MRHSPAFVRSLAVKRVQQKLLNNAFPRLQMALIVLLTGGFGLLASFSLLQFGLGSMALRYPLALGCSYLFFVMLIWLWLRANASDYLDLPDLAQVIPHGNASNATTGFHSGAGGDFGGGGASGSFEAPSQVVSESMDPSFNSAGDVLGSVAEADELAIPIIAIALAFGLALASLWVVYIAPILFAEVLVDGALSYALFRYLRGHEPHHWLTSTFRRTAVPFMVTALFLSLTGFVMSAYAPGAHSVGQVIHYASASQPVK